jgi:hypothetical protein
MSPEVKITEMLGLSKNGIDVLDIVNWPKAFLKHKWKFVNDKGELTQWLEDVNEGKFYKVYRVLHQDHLVLVASGDIVPYGEVDGGFECSCLGTGNVNAVLQEVSTHLCHFTTNVQDANTK